MTATLAVRPTEVSEALSDNELHLLADCEGAIARAERAFVEMGRAFRKIRDGRLYRVTHSSFEAYCEDRWEMGRHYANRLAAAATLADELVTTVTIPNEAVARQLLRAPEGDRQRLWDELTAEGERPTVQKVFDAVEALPAVRDEREKRDVASMEPSPDAASSTRAESDWSAAEDKCWKFVGMLRDVLDLQPQVPFGELDTDAAAAIAKVLTRYASQVAEMVDELSQVPT